jgi:hypothetical protein
LSASRRTTGAVAEVLSKECVVSLHSGRGRCVTIAHYAVDHVEAELPFVQPHFVVGLLGGVGEIHRAPFDVEDTIGRSARYRGVDAAGATRVRRAANPAQIISALVIPIRHDRVVVAEPRQADVGKVGTHGRELGIAV